MNIMVCIKQVPASSEVKIDPVTGNLIRDGKNVKLNPFDLFALEAAFQINEQIGGSIHALTMGPDSAIRVLKEAIYMGADKGTVISDRKFAGADVLATAYTISQMIDHIGNFDLVICGKQTTDGDTAQVGPEIAENLTIPHVPYVKEILEVYEDYVVVRSGYDTHDEIVKVTLPALLTIEKDANTPRLPSYKRKQAFKDSDINIIRFNDLKDQTLEHYGLLGSPTQVEEMFSPDTKLDSKEIKGDASEMAKGLFDVLKESQFI